MTYLVLFDVDGTLLLSHDELYVAANRHALREVYGCAPAYPDVPGETALASTRGALRRAGVAEAEIDAGLSRWCEAISQRYLVLLMRADTTGWRVAPHAAETLSRVERRALLTGNPERIARARLERLELDEFFPRGQGAFGCDREDRVGLFELARSRAHGWPASRTLAVGDTPRDIDTAHAAGARCIAVATGRYGAAELQHADAVIPELSELPEAIAFL